MFTIWQLNKRSLCISETALSAAVAYIGPNGNDEILRDLFTGAPVQLETLILCSDLATLIKLQTAQLASIRVSRLAA